MKKNSPLLRVAGAFSVCVAVLLLTGCRRYAAVTTTEYKPMPTDSGAGTSGGLSDPKNAMNNPNVPGGEREKIRQMMQPKSAAGGTQ